MRTAIVKFFDARKGFGFLTPEIGGEDVFIHISELNRSGITELLEGARVVFDVAPSRRKPGKVSAINVRMAA